MIVPWLRGFMGFSKAPITWALIATNIFIFLITFDPQFKTSHVFFSDQKKFEMTAQLYYQHKGGHGLLTKEKRDLYGVKALRDQDFIDHVEDIQFTGDEIAIQKWKMEMVQFRQQLQKRSVEIFGFHFKQKGVLPFITYQFMHAGFIHLLSNMLMLLIFCAALEQLVGSLFIFAVYLLGGIAGAFGFLILGDATTAPLIGASGSLSALMAFYAMIETKKRIPYFYFLSPVKDYFGWLWLPTWTIFIICFLPDVASYLGTSEEIGAGIAYTAHLGGMSFGIGAGLIYRKILHTYDHFARQ